MTTVVISQPMYFPWAGFFEHMALADVFIWLDDVKFSRGSFTNRIQVRCGAERKWMTVPVADPKKTQDIAFLRASNPDWKPSHRAMLRNSLRRRPYAALALKLFDEALSGERSLPDYLIASSERLAAEMGILPATTAKSSNLNVKGTGSVRVLDLVEQSGGTRYVTGHGAAGYLDHEAFERAGIEVDYMIYDPLPWDQDGEEFTPYVTALDLIASSGRLSRAHLQSKVCCWRDFLGSKESEA